MPEDIHPLLREDEQKSEDDEEALRIEKQKEPEKMTSESNQTESSVPEEEQNQEQPQEPENQEEEDKKVETPPEELEEKPKEPEQEEPQRPWLYQDDPNFIVLDRRTLGRDYVRLFNENRDFRAQASTTAGREAKREAQRRIQDLESEVERLRWEKRAVEVQGMSQEDISARMADDPEFAREYTEILHPPDPAIRQSELEAAAFENEIEDLWEEATVGGLPPQRVAEYQRAITRCPVAGCPRTEDHGFFDHNPSRSEPHRLFQDTYGNSAPAAALARLQSIVRQEISQARAPRGNGAPPLPPPPSAQNKKEEPAKPEAGKPNQKLTASKPDTSGNSSRNGRSQERITREDVRNMSWEERIERWPNDGDYEKDVREGRVLIPGLNSER